MIWAFSHQALSWYRLHYNMLHLIYLNACTYLSIWNTIKYFINLIRMWHWNINRMWRNKSIHVENILHIFHNKLLKLKQVLHLYINRVDTGVGVFLPVLCFPRGEISAHITSLIPPVPSQESEWSCICIWGVSVLSSFTTYYRVCN